MQYTDTVMQALPVLTSNGFYVTWNGTYTTALSPENAAVAADFRMADYWYRRHFLYGEIVK